MKALFLMGHPRPLFIYFWLFKQTLQILQQINVKKCPSCMWGCDLNSRPSEHEAPHVTTRPGLSPKKVLYYYPKGFEATDLNSLPS